MKKIFEYNIFMSAFLKKHGYTILLSLVILLGILLRLKGLLINPSMWHDECALAWNIKFKSYSDFFTILRFMQMAPPLFMVATKLFIKIFGLSDFSLRILPFLAGVGSIFVFYQLSAKTLKNKSVILWATFFFAINSQLINYSFEFKPYSLDVFFTIICLLFFINLDIEKLSVKKAVLYGVLLSIIPWFSFVSVLIIAGGFLNLLFENSKEKKFNTREEKHACLVSSRIYFGIYPICNIGKMLKQVQHDAWGEYFLSDILLIFKNIKINFIKKSFLILPMLISSLIYLKIYLINNYTGTHMVNYWQNSFITANPMSFMYLFVKNIRYFFFPMPYVLFALVLLIWGTAIFFREKSKFISISSISFILLIIASFLHFYPFSDRLVLFLIPIFLLLIIKPLDSVSFDKKVKSFTILLLMFFTFYPQIIFVNKFIHQKNISRGENPREMMDFMLKNIKEDDVIFVSKLSNTEFAYYSSFYNLKNQVIQEPQKSNRLEALNSIKKRNYCWFYLTFENPKSILDWVENNTKVIKLIHPKLSNDYLVYAYIK